MRALLLGIGACALLACGARTGLLETDAPEDAPGARCTKPRFAAVVDYPTGTSPFNVVAADLNGDGRLDLADVSGNDNIVSVFLNLGDGKFAVAVDYPTGASPLNVVAA